MSLHSTSSLHTSIYTLSMYSYSAYSEYGNFYIQLGRLTDMTLTHPHIYWYYMILLLRELRIEARDEEECYSIFFIQTIENLKSWDRLLILLAFFHFDQSQKDLIGERSRDAMKNKPIKDEIDRVRDEEWGKERDESEGISYEIRWEWGWETRKKIWTPAFFCLIFILFCCAVERV